MYVPKKEAPLLTIAIPTYNGFGTILDTLNSCIDFISPDIEILISDNGSDELSKNIIFDWIKEHEDLYITYFHHENNIGFDKNIISLFENAHGEFLHILGDDDAFYPNAIECLVNILRENKAIAGIVSNFDVYDKGFRTILNRLIINNNTPLISEGFVHFIKASAGRFGQVSSLTINRKMAINTNANNIVGTQYIHMYIIFKVLQEGRIYVNPKPILKIRTGAPHSEKKGDDKILVPLGALRVFRLFKNKAGFFFYWKYIFQNSVYLAKSIHGGKKQGLKYPFSTFLRLLKHECYNPFFWMLMLPIFLIPLKVISLLKRVKR